MLAKLLPVVMLLVGVGGGVGSGLLLAPKEPPEEAGSHEEKPDDDHAAVDEGADGEKSVTEFVKLNNQFVIPIIRDERVASLVVLSLSLETRVPMNDAVFNREPKLRDSFLQVLFDHANMGGFNGSFTDAEMLDVLRRSLRDVARRELGSEVENVLITDISRQDT
ncbi:flagellar basal body-associated FliL family protein [Sedimentitalea arenosa]|jgi:hypothetical protein|uniref:Flagellar protein FliL n=1 Tax=Sedimentitalea arenosa TaxID=2798803 RepID=A0A8J7IQP6_9RHOB|nr:flagellar basal body-associated FliL family protein [Arenibacterium arenosum]MBJ6371896.1 flagellar basal body-associated FliL family protein [Arenibacterium arenosum]